MAKHLFFLLLLLPLCIFAQPGADTDAVLPVPKLARALTATTIPAAPGYKYRQESIFSMVCNCITTSTDSTTYEYDAAGNKVAETFYTHQLSPDFKPFTKTTSRYDSKNRVTQQSFFGWQESGWVHGQQLYHKYADGAAADSAVLMGKNAQTAAWTNQTLTTYRYDEQGNLVEWLFHTWTDNKWKPSMGERFIRTGQTNGLFHEEIYQIYRATAGWSDTSKEVNTFTDGTLTGKVKYLARNNTWQPSWRYTNYEYTTTPEYKHQVYLHQLQQNGTWKDYQRHSYTDYTDMHTRYTKEEKTLEGTWRLALTQEQQFNQQAQLVSSVVKETGYSDVLEKKDSWIYDEQGNLVAEEGNYTRNGSYAGGKNIRYGNFVSFSKPLGLAKESETIAKVYPNPTQHTIYVEPHTNTHRNLTYELLDSRGRAIKTQTMLHREKAEIDLSSYPGGLYLLRLTDGKTVHTQKIIKE